MNKEYFHSVILRSDLCTGCTVCMQNCPTQAIRIIDGKAKIISEKCIDCCMCLKVCPYNAKTAITDSLIELQQYKYNIALPSLSFYAQFSQKYSKNAINLTLKSLGFE
ncbi:MAG: 4Fe-4S binding protein [Clostridiales bacterium]|nr:4Fe-4S binding protein [Clostridiales bacterium]